MKKKVYDETVIDNQEPVSDDAVVKEEDVKPVSEEKPAKKIEKVEAEVVSKGTVTAKMLNVRSGPSTDFLPVKVLYAGDTVEYTEENKDWLKLTSGGFVMRKFIKK